MDDGRGLLMSVVFGALMALMVIQIVNSAT